jgi:eukaryotic-like serine/threonine-protein kinase
LGLLPLAARETDRNMAQPPPPPDDPTVVEEVDPAYPGRRVVVDEPPPPPRRDIWGWLVAALMAAAAIVFLILWLNERDEGAGTQAVPDLVGLTQQEAQREANARGFALGIVRRPSDTRAGVVLEQAPRAGEKLESSGRMMAVVSGGRREVAVPQLVGLNRAAAKRIAQTAQLSLVENVVPSDRPAGLIVAQNPSAGQQVAIGSKVTVNVSRGPGLVAVPALQGLTLDRAVETLTAAGLVPRVIRVPSSAATDTVIAQDPPRGQRVKRGTVVRINVSAGTTATEPETVTVTTATTETVETTPP